MTLNSIDVPRDAYVVYANNMIKVVAGGEVLRTFRNIKHFFFWTGFNGTRSFVKGAPKDAYIYGGGNNRTYLYNHNIIMHNARCI